MSAIDRHGLDRPASRARVTVDLDALVTNWRTLRDMAAPARVAAVVKADAYGLGAEVVAPALAMAGCPAFFVARIEEGVRLRPLIGGRPIYVLDGLGAGGTVEALAFALTPVLNQPAELHAWRDAAKRAGRRLPAALQVDTGMARLGFAPADAAALADADLAGIELCLLMSHLACGDEAQHPLSNLQLGRFTALRRRFPKVPASLAASSGMFLGPAWRQDLCRPGIALYGGSPLAPGRPNPMQPVVTLEAPVLQVHDIDAPGTVGYGATYPVWPGTRVATLGLGYADGFPRAASGRATVRIAGQEVPLAGLVSMDVMSVDITGLPPDAVGPGTIVELIGPRSGVDPLAAAAGTVAYEILTRLGRRLERVWIGAQQP